MDGVVEPNSGGKKIRTKPRKLGNWLKGYLEFTENTECPKSYHVWCGISAIASVIGRKCWIPWDHMVYYPNLYLCLVGPPGGRKGTAMTIAKGLVNDADVCTIASESATRRALIDELAESKHEFYLQGEKGLITLTGSMLNVWSEEFAVFLGQRDEEMIPTLTDLFDSPSIWRHRTSSNGKATMENVFLNIIGAATPTLLQDALTTRTFGSGLFSRIIFIVEKGAAKKIFYDTTADEKQPLRADLIHDLQAISQLTGPFRWTSKALLAYKNWYEDPCSSMNFTDPRYVGYASRRAVHVRKLSLILSAAKGDTKQITDEDFIEALAFLEVAESNMVRLFTGIGKLDDSQLYAEITQFVYANKGATFEGILTHFIYDVKKEDLRIILETLVTAKVLFLDKRSKPHLYYRQEETCNYAETD